MALHAIEDVTDALDATRGFLRGLDRSQWLRLAVVALLTGGLSTPNSGYQFDAGSAPNGLPTVSPGSVGPRFGAVVVGVVAVALVVGLVLAILGSILQFTLVDALRTGDVRIRESLGRDWGKGLRLFAFNVAVGLVVAAAFVLAFAPLLAGNLLSVVFLLVFLPVAVVVALVVLVVTGLTRAFVVPIMLHEDRNVLPAWRRLWGVLRADSNEYVVFVLVNAVLTVVGGIVTAIGAVVALVLDGIVVGVVFGLPFALAGTSGPLAWAWLAVGLVLGAVAFLLAVGLVNAPVQAYLRYYALLLLGDTQPELDLVPDRRAAVRDETEE